MFKTIFKSSKINFALILIYVGIFFIFAFRPLSNNNEGLYASIALSMLKNSNFIIPHLDGVVYLEQPPLLYWLCAVFLKIFGQSEFSARLPILLSGIFLLISSYYFVKRFFDKSFALITALVLVSQICFDTTISMIMFDMLLTLFFSLYLGFSFSNRYYKFFYIFLALAIFTKGFVALVLSCLILIPFIIVKKIKLKDLHLFFGLIVFAVLSIWFIIVSIKIPSFFYYYFINNQFLRFLGQMYPNDTIRGPIYFYIVRLFACDFPWSILTAYGIYKVIKNKLYKNDFNLFMLLWFFSIFIFFSLSSGKANYYLLPAIFPITYFAVFVVKNENLNIFYYLLLVFGLVLFTGSILVEYHYIHFRDSEYIAKLPLVGLSFLILVFYFFAFCHKKFLVQSIGLANIVILVSLFLYYSLNVNNFTSKYATLWLEKNMKSNSVFVQDRPFWVTSSSIFYLNKDSLLLDDFDDGDLYYGMTLLKNKNDKFINKEQFASILKKRNIALITTHKKTLEYIIKMHFSVYKIKQFGNKFVVLLNKTS